MSYSRVCFVQDSKVIDKLCYDPKRKLLKVKFVQGGEWEYEEVPEIIFLSLLSSPSLGKAFNKLIRSHPYKRVSEGR